jgi:hypothetical protein
MLPDRDHSGFRYLAKLHIEKILKSKYRNNSSNRFECTLLKAVKQKVKDNSWVVTHVVKGKMVVATDNTEVHNKITKFDIENCLKRLAKDSFQKYQKEVRELNKNCMAITEKSTQYKNVKIKLKVPQSDVLVKLHKENQAIRLLIIVMHPHITLLKL